MTTLTRIYVPGMTGSDSVSAVTQQLKAVPGTGRMTVQLNSGEDAIISVLSALPIDTDVIEGAVAAAGFEVREVKVVEDALAREMAEQAPARQAARNPYRSLATPAHGVAMPTAEPRPACEFPTSDEPSAA